MCGAAARGQSRQRQAITIITVGPQNRGHCLHPHLRMIQITMIRELFIQSRVSQEQESIPRVGECDQFLTV
jgi:hypothetical protein